MFLSDQIKLWHKLKNFLNFLPQMFNSSSIVALAGNGGDWRSKSLVLPLMFSTHLMAFILPIACYALVAVILAVNFNRSKVFCSFLCVGKNILKLFLVYIVYIVYLCLNKIK